MRTIIKAAVTLAAFGASLAVAAPAQAATHVLSCDSGYNTIICELSAPADSIKWTMNGTYVPGWDNKQSISTPCSTLIRYSFKVTTVTGGVVETPVFNLACRSGAWR